MNRHWLCNDVMGFLQCANCLRNPEHECNEEVKTEEWPFRMRPRTSPHGCADQLIAPAGSAKGKADA